MTTDKAIDFNYRSVLFAIQDGGVQLTLRSWTDDDSEPSDSCPSIEIRSILDASSLDALVGGLASLLRYQVPSSSSWKHPLTYVRARRSTGFLKHRPSRQEIAKKEHAREVRARGPDELEVGVTLHGSMARFTLWNHNAHVLLGWLARHAGWKLSGLDDDDLQRLDATRSMCSAA
jgi:hypothetical protein